MSLRNFKYLRRRERCKTAVSLKNNALPLAALHTVSASRTIAKQGGVISPILFCIYIDDLLVGLSQLGGGCYIAGNFVGAIVYADDIVLIRFLYWW